jgi:hypothetical protein
MPVSLIQYPEKLPTGAIKSVAFVVKKIQQFYKKKIKTKKKLRRSLTIN